MAVFPSSRRHFTTRSRGSLQCDYIDAVSAFNYSFEVVRTRHGQDPAIGSEMLRLKSIAKSMFRVLTAPMPSAWRYQCQALAERAIYALTPKVHDLPPIFHYWSNRYLRPKMQKLGFDDPHDFFVKKSLETLRGDASKPKTILSLGCGRAELELAIAQQLIAGGIVDFVINGLDIGSAVIESAAQRFRQAGLGAHFRGTAVDINHWSPAIGEQYDLVIANHSLHHLVALERVFDQVRSTLNPAGCFLVCDMIGKNGHALWPEMKAEVERFWAGLPASKRFDRASGKIESSYRNYDASKVGFEGIRAQDILPLLLERFHFELFLPFGGIVVPFVERRFGWNFDPLDAGDLAFVDELSAAEERLFQQNKIKPTQMIAVLSHSPRAAPSFSSGFSPAECVRIPN